MSNNTGRRTWALGSGAARVAADRAKRVLSVFFAVFAAIALIAGVAVSGFSTPKAEAQVCTTETPVKTLTVDSSEKYASSAARRLAVSGLTPGDTVTELEFGNKKNSFGKSASYSSIFRNSAGELDPYGDEVGVPFADISGLGSKRLTYRLPSNTTAGPTGTFTAVVPISDNDAANFTVKATVKRTTCTTHEPEPSPEPTLPEPTSEATSAEPTPETPTPTTPPTSDKPSPEPTTVPPTSAEPSTSQTSTSVQPSTPTEPKCVLDTIPTSGGKTAGAADSVASGGLNQQLDFSFGNVSGTQYLAKLTIGAPSKFGSQPFGPGRLNWRFVYAGNTYVAGTDFTVSPANGNAATVSLVFHAPISLRANSSATLYLPVTGPNGAAPVTATASNCEPERLPNDPTTENPLPTDPNETTPRRDPNLGEQRLTVSARAFVPMFTGGDEDSHNARTSSDTRYTAGIRFELWSTSNDLGDALRFGPSAKVNEPWAYCVTDSSGECDIFVPDSYLGTGKRFYVKQVSNAPGTFHIEKVNWGKYGAANDRFEAYLPGPVRDVVKPGGKTVQERSYEVPPSKRYAGDSVQSINSNLTRTASQWSSFGSAAQSLNNPPLSQARKCQASGGPKIALVMDVTKSVKKNGSPDKYREAVYGDYGFLESLRGTGSEIAMFNFNESSPGRDQNYPQPLSVDTSLETLKTQAKGILSDFDDGTNWDSGLNAVKAAIKDGQKYDEVIFITDGDANGYGRNGSGDFNDGRSGYVRAIEAAIYRSNEIKEKGTRVVSIGVGSADDAPNWDGSGQLEAISGLKYGEDYFGTDWNRLAAALRAAASQVTCQNEIVVDKTIVDENGLKLADQSQATKWNVGIQVDNVMSEINWSHDKNPVQPAVLSPNASTAYDSKNPLVMRDHRPTPDSRWFLTFYGNAEPGSAKANRADITIAENTSSRAGYIFVPGTGQKSEGEYTGQGSWYEIRNLRDDSLVETGPMTSSEMKFPKLPQNRKLIVHLQNQPSVKVQKSAAQNLVTINANNTWTARYEVLAKGTSASETSIPRITDKPDFPDGFEITSVKVDDETRQFVNGEFEVAAKGSRNLSNTDFARYTVVVEGVYKRKDSQGKLVPLETLGDELKCQADGSNGPKKGMFNEVFMTPDVDGQPNNRACIPIVPDEKNLQIGVQKFGADKNGKRVEIDPSTGGYQFELRETGPGAGTPQVLNKVKKTEKGIPFSTTEAPIRTNTEYELVETKAPAGYSLLAEPIRFRVVPGANGVQVEFFDSASQKWTRELVNVSASSAGENAGLQLISVTDVHSGTLPRTGGNGLWPMIMVGLSIVGFGAAVGARRRAA